MNQGAVTDEREPEAVPEARPAADGAPASADAGGWLAVDADLSLEFLSAPSATDEDYAAALMRIREQGERDVRRAIYGLLRQIDRVDAEQHDADEWLRVVVNEMQAKAEKRKRARGFLEEQAAGLAETLLRPGGPKNVDVPGAGRIQFRDLGATVRIADPGAFIAWAKEHERGDLYDAVMVEKLKTTEAKRAAEHLAYSEGEELPGVELIPARRTASIQMGGR